MGRRLIPDIADVLKAQGLLEKETQFDSVDQLLDGLEKMSSRLAETTLGYLTYAKRQLSPYLSACVDQFSPQRRTLTQRLLDRSRSN
jgi:hypothetical protein